MNPLLWWLLQNFILVLILVVFVSIACLALKNRPALRHALWLVVLLKFVTPPIIVWPWSLEQVASSVVNVKTEDPNSERSASYVVLNTKSAQQNAGSNAHVESSDDVSASAIVSQTRSSPSSLTGNIANSRVPSLVLVTTWIAGCLVVLTIQIQRILRQRIVISTATTAPDILVREFEHVSRQLKVKPLNICVSNKTSSPFLYCLGPLRLVWPKSLSEKRELSRSRGIIAHELAHVRRRDHWAVWLEFIAGAIWWWNPLFWFVRTRLRESAEMACDAIALSVYDDRRAYAEIFLELSSTPKLGMPTTALGVSSGSRSSFEGD